LGHIFAPGGVVAFFVYHACIQHDDTLRAYMRAQAAAFAGINIDFYERHFVLRNCRIQLQASMFSASIAFYYSKTRRVLQGTSAIENTAL